MTMDMKKVRMYQRLNNLIPELLRRGLATPAPSPDGQRESLDAVIARADAARDDFNRAVAELEASIARLRTLMDEREPRAEGVPDATPPRS